MTVRYLLRITIRWMKSAKVENSVVRECEFLTEADAVSCRDAMTKAKLPKGFTVEFVRSAVEESL